ncbi:ABC transporter ATP-binding protein [Sporosarcina pasteurii]|uniref:Nickel import system ATP-binding protein NikD n=1 Tax=Sporosarcina pasteurii TaxID=1474 RepID=A0A380C9Y4_SPOPA|nr:ABC transporter ATP-binding protein [Sporosarcina pasteurii]MDS9472730.1 ABC transporter ATP-binding protein [Sporosarcina pasteurii]QBQ04384.1 ABC transporter ATP-binding protein [Sporosarcina pasteurii]SUJ15450.1 Glutathione import ATP-binding protein GsiA [Sporosarcina pasteurii]
MSILEVQNLSISFQQYGSGLKRQTLDVMSNLSIELEEGEILAVVGASGSGKSLLAHAILGILPENAGTTGTIQYDGEELTDDKLVTLRGKEIALIPQSVNFLDPLMQVGKQVRHSVGEGDAFAAQRAVFERYHLNPQVEKMYPFQLSGGMARRTLLSTAAVSGAKVIIADEPTPGLDEVVIQEALSNFREFANAGCAVMLITHDIESALKIADKIAVFYAGTVVEIASVHDFTGKGEKLRHPYSKALWNALPQNDFIPIPGAQPQLNDLPPGCLFAPRCPLATKECTEARPDMRELREGKVRCIDAT